MSTTTDAFEVRGGKSLSGTIIPQGAKNEALQVLSAVLLSDEDITYMLPVKVLILINLTQKELIQIFY